MKQPDPTITADALPDLTGRMAKCGCGHTVASTFDNSIAFFQFRGEGSRDALENCKNCWYSRRAHEPEVMAKNLALKCTNFEPHGPYEFDSFYCGCRGWE